MITVVCSLTGSKLFNDFLTRQLAQENLAFYIAVERYVLVSILSVLFCVIKIVKFTW